MGMNEQQPVIKTMPANGLEFGYFEAGEGPLVLCLHGFPDTPHSFLPLLDELAAAGFHAVAPFMRGYAPTSLAPRGDYDLLALGRDVLALIEHFGADRASLVGHDWGALAAYVAAVYRPDRVRRLVAVSMPHPRRLLLRPDRRQLWRLRHGLRLMLPRWAESHLPRDDFAGLDRLVHAWSPEWSFSPGDLAQAKAALANRARLEAALAYFRAIPRLLLMPDAWKVLTSAIAVPTRIVYGTASGRIAPAMFVGQEHLFAAGLELLPVAGAGHFVHREQPKIFNQAVKEFLKP